MTHDDHSHAPADPEVYLRVRALEELLIEKGLLGRNSVEEVMAAYEGSIGPMNGARMVARAWIDPTYKARMLANATTAAAELGFGGAQGEHLVAVENTPTVHNVIVCTLCSCYPWPVLGLPPTWYKEPAYRSKLVTEPRQTLRQEFGLELGDGVEIRVWDSNAEIRYMVLPERPSGTEHMTEDELAGLVSRDAMIGVAKVSSPM